MVLHCNSQHCLSSDVRHANDLQCMTEPCILPTWDPGSGGELKLTCLEVFNQEMALPSGLFSIAKWSKVIIILTNFTS